MNKVTNQYFICVYFLIFIHKKIKLGTMQFFGHPSCFCVSFDWHTLQQLQHVAFCLQCRGLVEDIELDVCQPHPLLQLVTGPHQPHAHYIQHSVSRSTSLPHTKLKKNITTSKLFVIIRTNLKLRAMYPEIYTGGNPCQFYRLVPYLDGLHLHNLTNNH